MQDNVNGADAGIVNRPQEKLVFFCKSYCKDMLRAKRMAESVKRFNQDHIPLYLSVPADDLAEFRVCFEDIPAVFLTDDDILAQTLQQYGGIPSSFPPHLRQQLVKLEFWRMGVCENYLWIDSDAYFVRPFSRADFFAGDDIPFTVMHDNAELLSFARRRGRVKIENDFLRMAMKMQGAFGRAGDVIDFGYAPLLWSVKVLQSLGEYLRQRHMTIYELLDTYPCEMQLYGEYLLYSKVIPVVPTKPFFKVYHYVEQFYEDQEKGESEHSLARQYLGVVMQSNWARVQEEKPSVARRLITHLFRNDPVLGGPVSGERSA